MEVAAMDHGKDAAFLMDDLFDLPVLFYMDSALRRNDPVGARQMRSWRDFHVHRHHPA